jgi:PmbA protein
VTEPIDLARSILERAEDGEAVEVCVGRSVRTEVRVHRGEVESLTLAESHGIGVRVILQGPDGNREGLSHAGSFDADVVDDLLAEARDNALFAEPDPHVALARPDGVPISGIDPWSDEVEKMSVDDKIAIAIAVEAAALAADPRVRGARTSVYGDSRSESAIVSTAGIETTGRSTGASTSTMVLIDDVDGGTRTGSAVDASQSPLDLDPQMVADRAVQRGLQLLDARQPTTGRPSVVFEPRFAATVLGLVAAMLAGDRVVKGRTPFADRIGQQIAATLLTMFDDPTDAASLGASATDGEGLACRRVPLVSNGVLDGFLHDCHTARVSGSASTGSALRSVRGTPSPGFRALHVAAGRGDLASFIADIDDGFLVAGLQGLHSGVNAVSGDLSVGVEGIRIRDGVLAEPIREATLAGAIPRMLFDITRVGDDLERLPGGSHVPSIVIDGLTLGGSGS